MRILRERRAIVGRSFEIVGEDNSRDEMRDRTTEAETGRESGDMGSLCVSKSNLLWKDDVRLLPTSL